MFCLLRSLQMHTCGRAHPSARQPTGTRRARARTMGVFVTLIKSINSALPPRSPLDMPSTCGVAPHMTPLLPTARDGGTHDTRLHVTAYLIHDDEAAAGARPFCGSPATQQSRATNDVRQALL